MWFTERNCINYNLMAVGHPDCDGFFVLFICKD